MRSLQLTPTPTSNPDSTLTCQAFLPRVCPHIRAHHDLRMEYLRARRGSARNTLFEILLDGCRFLDLETVAKDTENRDMIHMRLYL